MERTKQQWEAHDKTYHHQTSSRSRSSQPRPLAPCQLSGHTAAVGCTAKVRRRRRKRRRRRSKEAKKKQKRRRKKTKGALNNNTRSPTKRTLRLSHRSTCSDSFTAALTSTLLHFQTSAVLVMTLPFSATLWHSVEGGGGGEDWQLVAKQEEEERRRRRRRSRRIRRKKEEERRTRRRKEKTKRKKGTRRTNRAEVSKVYRQSLQPSIITLVEWTFTMKEQPWQFLVCGR